MKLHPQMKNKTIVGKIYADWCGHCQSLMPEWQKMKKLLSGKNITFKEIEQKQEKQSINNVNYTYLIQSAEKLTSSGYPTIFMIKDGKLKYYNGDRNALALSKWVMMGGGPSPPENKRLFGLFGGKNKTRRNKSKKSRKTKKSWFSW